MEEEERAGRAVNSEEAAKLPSLRQRMDIDDSDIIITGATNTRISRQQVMEVNYVVGSSSLLTYSILFRIGNVNSFLVFIKFAICSPCKGMILV